MSEKGYLQTKKLCVGYQKHIVVDNIEISLEQGEILTLIGPNGAGKSTVLKSIARQLETLGGSIYLDQKELSRLSGQQLSQSMAVVMTQKLRAEKMTCEDVVATGRYPYTGRFGILSSSDWKVIKEAMELVQVTQIKDLDFNKVSDGQRQRVMLARAICQEPEVIILDEPTAVLTPQETEKLFNVLRNMRADGKAIVIITHKLHEVMSLSDKVAVLRKGQYIGTVNTSETNPQALTDMMVGHAVTLNIDRPRYENPVPRLTLQDVTCYDNEGVVRLDHVSFTAMGGEILGVAGIAGSGQRELLESIADTLGVSVNALKDYGVETAGDLMSLLVRLEDSFGIAPASDGSGLTLNPNAPHAPKAAMAIELWAEKRAQLENGEIDANEYEDWKASL